MKRQIVKPDELIGQEVAAVEFTNYDLEDGYKEIVLTLLDGRRFEMSSCDCCSGASFCELVEEES